jgi:hypothetical protein
MLETILLRLKSWKASVKLPPDQPERERGLSAKPPVRCHYPTQYQREGGRCTGAEYSVCAANPMDGMGTADVGAARLRKTEKSYLPLLDQITDRVGHLLDRDGRISAAR